MGKHRQKSGDKVDSHIINLITALINLITTLILLLEKLKR